MIRGILAAGGATVLSAVTLRALGRRASDRLLAAPRTTPDEAALGPALDALGGEVVRLHARDGVRLAARWLAAERDDPTWAPDPHEAVLLLHGYSGSIAPDLVEYGPYLRRTASVLGLDFRGHGLSDDGPSTFGLLETEDVAGALAWLGERGITRVALMGTSMGGIVAISSVVVLGDGSLPGADLDPAAPRDVEAPPRPVIVGVIADSVAPELEIPIASRLRGPARRFVAARLFDGATRTLGSDPRATEPARIIGLVEPVPLLLIHGEDDDTVPVVDGMRLAALAGPGAEHWIVPGATHSGAHAVATEDYERRTADFLRMAFTRSRGDHADGSVPGPIIGRSGDPTGDPTIRATPVED
jgi:pimeloyl-ACP methyl ester carboxylesterase